MKCDVTSGLVFGSGCSSAVATGVYLRLIAASCKASAMQHQTRSSPLPADVFYEAGCST